MTVFRRFMMTNLNWIHWGSEATEGNATKSASKEKWVLCIMILVERTWAYLCWEDTFTLCERGDSEPAFFKLRLVHVQKKQRRQSTICPVWEGWAWQLLSENSSSSILDNWWKYLPLLVPSKSVAIVLLQLPCCACVFYGNADSFPTNLNSLMLLRFMCLLCNMSSDKDVACAGKPA